MKILKRRLVSPRSVIAVLLAAGFVSFISGAFAARIKDLTQVEGVRSNQLFGYGLIVGLAGTGDRQNTEFTVQTVTNLLREYRIRVNPQDVRTKNIAAVMVLVEIPPYVQPGARLDAVVSSLGDAQSLSGGTLLLTPLKGPDGRVYAVSQGPVTLGGGYIASGIGTRLTKNHQTVGRVSGGVLVERDIPSELLSHKGEIKLNIKHPDFTTARRIAEAINVSLPQSPARPISPGVVMVSIPPEHRADPIAFIATIESLEVSPERPARVVVNERTGTVIIGENVRIAPVAVAHGGLHITVKTERRVSQPPPFSEGQTVVVPDTAIMVEEPGKRQLVELPGGPGVKLGEIVLGLNALGVTPLDLVAVFEALREAGALQAELVIM
ncbi:MAG: flagellar basal body P-ring protein FlgI [Deltaproteobacteria bacterium]|nr:flagellar basal body P-ring protein FlgI [Deltaproteobacteria bacterium]